MGRSRTSKRVTWAPDVNLCQVRLFSKSGMCVDTWKPIQSSDDDELPPGFHNIHPTNMCRSHIPLPKWTCPPRFEVNSEWQVVSGEESKELDTQNWRQTRVVEAIYPRASAIPPNPGAPLDAVADDRNTPVVSLTPIEECSANDDIGLGDQNNLIDHDLLLRILQLQNIITTQNVPLDSSSTVAPSTTQPPQLGAGFYVPSHTMKDARYYKSLVEQHGGVEKWDVPLQRRPRQGRSPNLVCILIVPGVAGMEIIVHISMFLRCQGSVVLLQKE